MEFVMESASVIEWWDDERVRMKEGDSVRVTGWRSVYRRELAMEWSWETRSENERAHCWGSLSCNDIQHTFKNRVVIRSEDMVKSE